jgi:histone deacetylase 1/2
MKKVMDLYQPGAIVLQCGADSLAADRLGCFNLSLEGHAECVSFMKSFKIPILVTGGGGYTKSNVSRCWTRETAALLDKELCEDIPNHDFYYQYYSDGEYKLKVTPTFAIENLNTKQYLQSVKNVVLQNLNSLEHAPGVQMQIVPSDNVIPEFDEDSVKRAERWSTSELVYREDEFY